MEIATNPHSPERAVISLDTTEEQRAILGWLPLKESLHSRYRLFLQRLVGQPRELSISHDDLDALAGNIYYKADRDEPAAGEVHDVVTNYLASSQQRPQNPADLY